MPGRRLQAGSVGAIAEAVEHGAGRGFVHRLVDAGDGHGGMKQGAPKSKAPQAGRGKARRRGVSSFVPGSAWRVMVELCREATGQSVCNCKQLFHACLALAPWWARV